MESSFSGICQNRSVSRLDAAIGKMGHVVSKRGFQIADEPFVLCAGKKAVRQAHDYGGTDGDSFVTH